MPKTPRPSALVAVLMMFLLSCAERGLDAKALLARGIEHRGRGDYALALKDYDAAIALDTAMASAYSSRGFIYQLQGDYARALQDFDKALSLNPTMATALKNRGRTHFYLGHFAEAADDLRKGLAFDSSNTYNVISLHIAMRRLGHNDSADFAAQLARTDSVQWPAAIARFYRGTLSAEQLLAAADTVTNKDNPGNQRCAAAFYIGEQLLWNAKPAEARSQFEYAVAQCPTHWSEYHGAKAELVWLTSAQK